MGNKSKRRRTKGLIPAPPRPARIKPKPDSAHITQTLTQTQYTGPIPDPEALARYDKIHDGLAVRLVSMAEAEATHRRDKESRIIAAQVADTVEHRRQVCRGQWMAFVLSLVFLGCGAALSFYDHDVSGSILGSVGLVGLVSAFLGQRRIGEADGDHPSSEDTQE